MALRETAIQITGQGFDIERGLLGFKDATLTLIRSSKTGLQELRVFDKWFIKRDASYRNQSVFHVATLEDISEEVLLLTYIAYNGKLYSIEDRDISEPDGDRFDWMFFGNYRNEAYP